MQPALRPRHARHGQVHHLVHQHPIASYCSDVVSRPGVSGSQRRFAEGRTAVHAVAARPAAATPAPAPGSGRSSLPTVSAQRSTHWRAVSRWVASKSGVNCSSICAAGHGRLPSITGCSSGASAARPGATRRPPRTQPRATRAGGTRSGQTRSDGAASVSDSVAQIRRGSMARRAAASPCRSHWRECAIIGAVARMQWNSLSDRRQRLRRRGHALCRRAWVHVALRKLTRLVGARPAVAAAAAPRCHGDRPHGDRQRGDPAEPGTPRSAASPAATRPAPDLSGFRLMPLGKFSLDTRVQLARRAEVSLDVQYYHFENDETGRWLLRALRDAADRGVRVRLLIDDFYTGGQDELFARVRRAQERRGAHLQPVLLRARHRAGRALPGVGGRLEARQPPHAQQAVHRRRRDGGDRRAQRRQRILPAQPEGRQLHRRRRLHGRLGAAAAAGPVRPLLERRRGLPDPQRGAQPARRPSVLREHFEPVDRPGASRRRPTRCRPTTSSATARSPKTSTTAASA